MFAIPLRPLLILKNYCKSIVCRNIFSVLGGMRPAKAGSWMNEICSDGRYRYTAHWHLPVLAPQLYMIINHAKLYNAVLTQ